MDWGKFEGSTTNVAVCGTVREEVTTTIQIIWVNNSKLSIWHLFSTKSFLLDAGELTYKCCWTDFRHWQIAIICWQTGCWQNDMLAKQLAFLHTTRGLSIKDDCSKTILQKELVFLTHWCLTSYFQSPHLKDVFYQSEATQLLHYSSNTVSSEPMKSVVISLFIDWGNQ